MNASLTSFPVLPIDTVDWLHLCVTSFPFDAVSQDLLTFHAQQVREKNIYELIYCNIAAVEHDSI